VTMVVAVTIFLLLLELLIAPRVDSTYNVVPAFRQPEAKARSARSREQKKGETSERARRYRCRRVSAAEGKHVAIQASATVPF
jgi:hypothetical protein